MRVLFLLHEVLRVSGLIGLAIWLLTGTALRAGQGEPEFFRSALTGGLAPVVDLRGEWIDVDRGRIQVPFADEESDRRDLGRLFDLPDLARLPDTLYLYFEGLAWSAEVRLNGALLTVTDDPFAEYLLPVRKEWLQARGNQVQVALHRSGPSQVYYPRRFLGIFRQACLLGPDSLHRFATSPQEVPGGKRAAVIAPWSPGSGVLHDTVILGKALDGMFAYPFSDPVYFPFRPSSRSLAMAARLGVTVLSDLDRADSLCFYNVYPISREAGEFSGRFWRDGTFRPTAAYGKFLSRDSLSTRQLRSPDKIALLILLLGPVFLMLMLKLIAPRLYAALPEYLTKTKIYLELIASSKFLKDEQRWIMNLMRMVLTAAFVSLYLYYVGLSGDWGKLNILSRGSFLFHYFDGTAPGLYSIFLRVLAAVVALNLGKYFVLNMIGGIYRVFGLSATVQNLDIFASFPLNLLPLAPAAVIFFMDAEAGNLILHVWHAFILVYLARRFILVFSGLTKLFQFSTGIKILYICTLELAPWIFLI